MGGQGGEGNFQDADAKKVTSGFWESKTRGAREKKERKKALFIKNSGEVVLRTGLEQPLMTGELLTSSWRGRD